MRHIVASAIICLLLLAGTAGAQTNAAIIAGQSLGGVRIGGSVTDALSAWGTLFDREEIRAGKYFFYDWPLRPVFAIVEKEGGKITLLGVLLSDAYRTDKGNLTGGSERQAVEAAYGREFEAVDNQAFARLVYDTQGIAFDIGKMGVMGSRVVQIMVFAPGQWKDVSGVP